MSLDFAACRMRRIAAIVFALQAVGVADGIDQQRDGLPLPSIAPVVNATESARAVSVVLGEGQPGERQGNSPAAASPSGVSRPANCSCSQVPCSCAKKQALNKAAASAHHVVHYLNDFSYLNDPCYTGNLLGDSLKQRKLGPSMTFDFGGQYRTRFHSEENHRGLGLTGRSDDFYLRRTRLYTNVERRDVRFFFEVLDANSSGERFAPRPIEENRWDVQNAFIDLTLIESDAGKLVARGGRQEILLGAQRYVSPLDWSNTRRTFDGGRLTFTNDRWTTDGFWLAPMVRNRDDVDEANEDVALYGVYSTYKQAPNGTVDLYWLAFDNQQVGFYYDSLGARYNASFGQYLFEFEGAYQFGENADDTDHDAGFATLGLGRSLACHRLKPTTWFYFDWASGAAEQGAGNGHHHFQPLAHKYNGFIDLFGRRNLVDVNVLNTLTLSDNVKLLTWYHSFWLENDRDTPYNVNMSAFAPGITPGDNHLGQELDVVLNIDMTARYNILFGYSYFWSGDYYDTPGLPSSRDADFFYTQFTTDF